MAGELGQKSKACGFSFKVITDLGSRVDFTDLDAI